MSKRALDRSLKSLPFVLIIAKPIRETNWAQTTEETGQKPNILSLTHNSTILIHNAYALDDV